MHTAKGESLEMAITRRKWKGGYTYRVQVYHKRKVVAGATFDTRREAAAFEVDVKSKLQSGSWVDRSAAENMTLAQALDKYIETVSIKKKQACWREASQARQIQKYPIAGLPLASIKSADVAAFRDQRGEVVGLNSVRLALALVSHVFTTAIREWHMDYLINPCSSVAKPSVKRTQRNRRLQDDEYERLIAAAKVYGGTMSLIIQFAVETAMRQGEIAFIQPRYIDGAGDVIHLPDTKNGEARSVPLSSIARGLLAEVVSMGSDPVFGMTDQAISKAFSRICKRCMSLDGERDEIIINLHFHDLRHEATSRLFEKGLSTEQVKAITGHKTYQMLARYTHLRAADLVSLLG
ncbi:site-specific integrase [Mariprofundus ferrooxydans]|nr:site-specific integrase [Mariprofundus ferrooxydans]